METTYKVEGMTCGGCVKSVTQAILRVAPDAQVDVELAGGRVKVTGGHKEAEVRQAVEDAGFDFEGRVD